MNKKKIAFVVGKLSAGGAERVICNLSNVLIERFDITIIPHIKSEPFYFLDDRIKIVPCLNKFEPSSSTLQSIKLNFYLIKRISQIVKEQNIDLIIGFITSANILTTIASKINRIPCLISERNNPNERKMPRFWLVLRSLIYPLANHLIVQTKGVKKIYEKKIKPYNLSILPNPISSELSNLRRMYTNREKIILTVGRLDDNKNHDILIEAFNALNKNEWKVKIIGDGPKKEYLLTLIENYNLTDKIEIISQVKDIDKYYNEASVFVLTSRTEGFPNALLEAMHFGLPCISTDCNFGPSDLIDDGINGFLIPINNPIILKDKLTILMNNEDLRKEFSIKSRKTTLTYESKIVVKEWEKLILNFI